jgi:hypothetical protein
MGLSYDYWPAQWPEETTVMLAVWLVWAFWVAWSVAAMWRRRGHRRAARRLLWLDVLAWARLIAKAGMESAADVYAESERSRTEAAKAMIGVVRILQEVAKGEVAGMKTAAQIEGMAARLEYDEQRTRQRHRLQDERREELAGRRAEERRPTWQEGFRRERQPNGFGGGNDTVDAAGWRRVE